MTKVVIDGVVYVPAKPPINGKGILAALDVRFDSDAGDNLTVREYLQRLLAQLWNEQEGFSSKRPFGNSCWEYDLYTPLAKAGFIQYAREFDGCIEFDKTQLRLAHAYVSDLISASFFGVSE